MPNQQTAYENFRGALKFKTSEEAEESLLKLQAMRREYLRRGDRLGAAKASYEVKRGLRRLRMIAGNPRVGEGKRREKAELALWFEAWLIAPGAFDRWLRLRKKVLTRAGP
jgi:hypothetical protein